MINKSMAVFVAGILFLLFICAETNFAQTRKAVSAAETNGTFRDYFGDKTKKNFSEIKILSIGKGKLKVSFRLLYPNRGGGNVGEADGTATIKGDTATFLPPGAPSEYEQCKITIQFVKPGQIEVKQQGNDSDCGFGFNVNATGTYKRISGVKPKFKSSK